ncbi:Protein FAR-RED impared response 1 [Apostasia shenzhenica]|uniref:Protein FAR-RED impared response 1 n=1 Tax=Apostasia shenzhenica TaxID=1088818 RepID=A0A2I0B6K5_9ASPA|nr:Protein FAR-RED impared response 1 [Apostasia shenzhenica]
MVEGKIVAICQYGGEFVANFDGSLTYSGGEAHAVDVGQEMLFDEFRSEISSMFNMDLTGTSIKYFLPNNRKTLITISNDKDLRRMIYFNENSTAAEVYIVNKFDQRSTVADSGTSMVAVGRVRGQNKRKWLHGGARTIKRKSCASELGNSITATSAIVDNADNFKQNGMLGYADTQNRQMRQIVAGQTVDTRIITADFAMPVVPGAEDIGSLRLQGLANVDIDERATRSMLFYPSSSFVTSSDITESVRPLSSNSLWDDVITGVGQEFDNVKDFRAQLCKYAISKGFVYKFIKNESSRVTVKCSNDQNCSWRIHASESSHKQKFVIKKMNNIHTCGGGNGKHGQRRATRQWLTSIIKEKLHESPQCKPKEIVRELYEDYGVSLTYSQVWRGREVAQKELFSNLKETYSLLPWHCERIMETNPGSIAILHTSVDSKFRRFFISYHASLHGFEHGCRPLVFLDRIPLKSNNQCKLLAAVSVDGNDAIFPIAFAVVEDETCNSWLWFLAQFKCALAKPRPITFISDRQKGLDEAVSQVFPDGYHSYFIYQLVEDFKAELRKGPWSQQQKDAMADDFTRAAQACTIEDFHSSIASIRTISSDVADWVMASKPDSWSDALFKGSRYDHLSLNIVDSFSNWIPVKCESLIVLIVNAIQNKLMELMHSRQETSHAWEGILTPSMQQKLHKEVLKAPKLNVLCSSDTIFEVRGNTIYVVNIGDWTCSCRRWQISGLPCPHSIAVFNHLDRSIYDYCLGYYRIDCYRATYAESIQPIPDIASVDFNAASLYFPAPHRAPSRPRRKRFNPHKTVTVVRLCSRCKAAGHNKATCEALL